MKKTIFAAVAAMFVSGFAFAGTCPVGNSAAEENKIQLVGAEIRDGGRTKVNEVVANPDEHSPFVLTFAAEALIKDGQLEKGVFLRQLAMLRNSFDTSIIKDESDKALSSVMVVSSSPAYKEYVSTHLVELRETAKKVAEWDATHEASYHRSWMTSKADGCVPVEQWADLKVKARESYIKKIDEVIELLEKGKK